MTYRYYLPYDKILLNLYRNSLHALHKARGMVCYQLYLAPSPATVAGW
jgi:hypothetical protein